MSILDELRAFRERHRLVLGKRAEKAFSFKLTANLQEAVDRIPDKSELAELLNIVVALWVDEQMKTSRLMTLLCNGNEDHEG